MIQAIEVLAWPSVVVLCVLGMAIIFRNPLTELITRARKAAYGNKSVEFGDRPIPEQQQKKMEVPYLGTATIPATHALPPPSEVHAPIEEEIIATLAKVSLPADIEKAWLIRGVAAFRIGREHEVIYRQIFGSQFEALLQANTRNPPSMHSAREIYDRAKASFPDLYSNFPFERWFQFPLNMGLLRLEAIGNDSNILRITPRGQDFLHYLVSNSLTAPKYG